MRLPSLPFIITFLAAAACTFSGPSGNEQTIDAGPLADADEECEPTCDGDTLVRCGEVAIDCPLGCDGATVSCNLLLASNNADSHGFPSAELGDWDIDGPATINTDTGEVTVNGTQQRPPIVGIESEIGFAVIGGAGVFVANSWTVTGGISVIGTRPLIVVSAGDVQLERVIDLSSGQAECTTPTPTSCPGPGGGDGSTSVTAAGGCAFGGEGVQGVGNIPETGGGGGGGLRVGGPGGDSSGGDMAVGGSGGSINPNTACVSEELIPLVGGSGGGRGGEEVGNNAVGGGAGGAIQITSSTAIRFIGDPNRAGIRASGSGGQGGVDGSGGGGGGSGGAILLEAPLITFENVTLAANGGGGGGGGGGDDGMLGLFSRTRAGGGAAGANGTAGGLGGASVEPSVKGDDGVDETGGGGGGAGRIRLNFVTRSGESIIISPAPTEGGVTPQPSI